MMLMNTGTGSEPGSDQNDKLRAVDHGAAAQYQFRIGGAGFVQPLRLTQILDE